MQEPLREMGVQADACGAGGDGNGGAAAPARGGGVVLELLEVRLAACLAWGWVAVGGLLLGVGRLLVAGCVVCVVVVVGGRHCYGWNF